MVLLVAAFLLWMRRLAIRHLPDSRVKSILLFNIWHTDWERAARERAGIFPPPAAISARGLRWARAGQHVGQWVRRRLT